jgi:hypothetical protein
MLSRLRRQLLCLNSTPESCIESCTGNPFLLSFPVTIGTIGSFYVTLNAKCVLYCA